MDELIKDLEWIVNKHSTDNKKSTDVVEIFIAAIKSNTVQDIREILLRAIGRAMLGLKGE